MPIRSVCCLIVARNPSADLLVSPPLVRFSVHAQLISRYSVYFRKALLGAFAEGKSKVVTLDQESVSDVSLFLDWLYTGRDVMHLEESSEDEGGQREMPQSVNAVPVAGTVLNTERNNSDDDSDVEDESEADDATSHTSSTPSVHPDEIADEPYEDVRPYVGLAFKSILDLYIFADRRGVQKLQNDIINQLAAWREAGFPLMSASVSRVHRVYDLLPPNSPLRMYLIEEAGFCWDQDVLSAVNFAGLSFRLCRSRDADNARMWKIAWPDPTIILAR
ncbi:hypothetical protein LTR15_012698 [Elasticomyces elasticus]|nr:hypothetical protein LTR15_012698 [Elasticomyces elasticus]